MNRLHSRVGKPALINKSKCNMPFMTTVVNSLPRLAADSAFSVLSLSFIPFPKRALDRTRTQEASLDKRERMFSAPHPRRKLDLGAMLAAYILGQAVLLR